MEGAVQGVLLGHRLGGMRFRCGPTLVSPGGYRAIAGMVGRREIHVSTEVVRSAQGVPIPGSAFYAAHDSAGNARADTFYLAARIDLRIGSSASLTGRALLVHEATHALQDYQSGARSRVDGMPRAIAETAAYLAQALYYRLNGDSFRDRSLELRERRAREGVVMSAAAREAGNRLLDALEPVAERLSGSPGGDVRGDEYDAIKRSILGHPLYAGRGYEPAGMDGISAHHAP